MNTRLYARENLYLHLELHYGEKKAHALIDAYTHQLAEKIRAEIKDPNPLASIFQPFAGTLAANLIDPDMSE